MRWPIVVLALAALAIPAAATASGAPAHAAAARAGSLTLRATHANGSAGAVISDARWGVTGVVAHYVAGQRVTLHVFRDGALVLTRTVAVRRQGSRGVFHDSLTVGGIGRVSVRAIHFATAAQRRPRRRDRSAARTRPSPRESRAERSRARSSTTRVGG